MILLAVVVVSSGCNADVSPGAQLSKVKKFYVVHLPEDGRGIDRFKNSTSRSGLFAKIVSAGQSDYQLAVQIVRLDQPMFGTSFTVNLEATWRLLHSGDQKLVWEKAITSSSTATFSDAFSGVTRLRLANEGAARNNIQEAIAQMSALSLP